MGRGLTLVLLGLLSSTLLGAPLLHSSVAFLPSGVALFSVSVANEGYRILTGGAFDFEKREATSGVAIETSLFGALAVGDLANIDFGKSGAKLHLEVEGAGHETMTFSNVVEDGEKPVDTNKKTEVIVQTKLQTKLSYSKHIELMLKSDQAQVSHSLTQADSEQFSKNAYKVRRIVSPLSQGLVKLGEPAKNLFKFDKNSQKKSSEISTAFLRTSVLQRSSNTKTLFLYSPQFSFEYYVADDSVETDTPQWGWIKLEDGQGVQLPTTQVQYDPLNFMNSWAVMSGFSESGEREVDLHFVPVSNYFESASKLFGEAGRVHFAFGFWQGHIISQSGRIEFEGLPGLAVKVNHN